jgi:hypothetical protein
MGISPVRASEVAFGAAVVRQFGMAVLLPQWSSTARWCVGATALGPSSLQNVAAPVLSAPDKAVRLMLRT